MTEPLDPMLPRDDGPNGREPMLPSPNATDIRSTGFAFNPEFWRMTFGALSLSPISFIEVAGWRDPAPEEPNEQS